MIDLNNQNEVERLKKIASSPNGRVIVEFLNSQLETSLSYEAINTNQTPDKIALDYLSISHAREFIYKIIRLLTPEKGD